MIAALRRGLRIGDGSEPALTAAFWLLMVATVLPLWIGRYLPLLDIPNHLSAIAVWHYYDDPRFDFAKYYTLNLKPLPYWAHYYLCHLLAYPFGVETANKLFLTAYAVGLPSGALALARRFGRSPWLALFVFPLVWNFNLAEGFIAYSAGMSALVLVLVLVDKNAERPTLWRALLVFGLGSSIYFFHLLTYMLFLVCAGLLVFTQREPLRLKNLILRGVPVLACAWVGVWAYRNNSTMGFATMIGPTEFVNDPWNGTLYAAPARLLNFLSSSRDEWVVVVLAFSWFLIALSAARQRRTEPSLGARALGIEVCLAASLLAILFMPRSMQRPFNWYMINGRYVPLAALFFALTIRGPVLGWRRWLFAPVVAASLFYVVDIARMVVLFNRHIDGFDQLVAQIPLHKNTLTLIYPPLSDPQVNVNCFNQWPSYTQLRRGGYNFYNFNYGFPLKYKMYLPAPPWNHTEWFNFTGMASGWDYFLTHNEAVQGEKYAPFAEPLAQGKIRLVDARGSWRLYQKLADPDPPKPAVLDLP